MCPVRFTRYIALPGRLQRAAYMPPPDCQKTFFGFMQHLRPNDWFVGNGLDRSVLPRQKHDTARKPRAIRRDFMRCARPDVRMGQDPSLQISRKRTFSTSNGRHSSRAYKSTRYNHYNIRSRAGHAPPLPCIVFFASFLPKSLHKTGIVCYNHNK